MKITNTKEFMQVIAKHYEECKEVYLRTMYNIPFKLIDGRRWIPGNKNNRTARSMGYELDRVTECIGLKWRQRKNESFSCV